jgi:formylglycine-generating enzyme required for sulfatase activity
LIASISVEDRESRRRVSADDFPLSLGGTDADIRLPGIEAGDPIAWLGISDHELFIEVRGEAGRRAGPITCNGVPILTSQWLHDGDRLRIGAAQVDVRIRGGEIHLAVDRAAQRKDPPPPLPCAPQTAAAPPASSTGAEPPVRMIRPIEFAPARGAGAARPRPGVRPTTLVLAALVALLAAIAWFAGSARSVVIRIEPEPDRVILRTGWSGMKLGERYLVRRGRYTLSAAKSGYHDLEVELEVGEERRQVHRFALDRLPGRLAIEGGGALQTLRIDLASRAAPIRFSSRPAGATVRVDGNHIGVTPVTADLMEGGHRIAYHLSGYKPFDDSLVVEAGRRIDLPPVELQPLDGTIALRSTPVGAAVTVDGIYRGETPLDLALPPGRDHAIRLSKPGHEAASRQVLIAAGERREMALQLEVIEGEVAITATPADADLYVNGEARGRAEATLRLPAIAHAIEIRKPGYETYRTTITPRPGFPQAIEIGLVKSEEAGAPPQRIQSPQGQELMLIQGGRFTMGAPRREPGRRANESLRQVGITRSFYISARVVTNAEFRRFRPAHDSGTAGAVSLDADDYPVVQAAWEDAALYCNWLSEQASLSPVYAERDGRVTMIRPLPGGYRLPTEAEWAWVARYDEGPQPGKYPWGDALPVAPGSGNYADESAAGILARVIPNYNDTFPATAPAGSFQPNAFGLYNIGGNVAEWMHDIYAIHPSGASAVEIDPLGPDEGELHVIRGSSWMDSSISELRLTYRDYGKKARPDVGFRIVRYAE